jgi:hypothetical protein
MIEEIVGTNGSRFILAIGVVALGLLCLVAVLWFIRNRPSSPFIRGGKNRQPRLAVLDAAAVDTRRRLVLIRRDDVEHLVMIGGPTDIVIESRIAGGGVPLVAQPAVHTASVEQPAPLTRPVAERRQPAAQPVAQPEQKPQPAASRAAPQVSAMGNVLYGENFDPAPQARGAQPVVERPRTEPQAARPVQQPTVTVPARPEAAVSAPAGLTVQHARTPEDILEAARNRVLPSTQPVVTSPTPEQKTPAADFERILDAEISGDLSRLNVGSADIRVGADPRGRFAGPVAKEPASGAARQRTEPTLEEEMNRMLGEMSAGEKR